MRSTADDERTLRNRAADQAAELTRVHSREPTASPTLLVRVFDGGAIPTALDRVFLTHPVTVAADESEGATIAYDTDTTSVIPVVVVGTITPVDGDLLFAESISGRWLADNTGTPATCLSCGPVCIPKRNLTLSWTNVLIGGGTTLLTFDGVSVWESGCANQCIFRLECVAGSPIFTVTYFPSGGCPTGSSSTCDSAGGALNVVTMISSPFVVAYGTAGCSTLATQGYTLFTITE